MDTSAVTGAKGRGREGGGGFRRLMASHESPAGCVGVSGIIRLMTALL